MKHRDPAPARTGRRPLRIALTAGLLTGVVAITPLASSTASASDVWSTPVDLSEANADSTLPQVSSDSNGNAVAVWLRASVPDTNDVLCDAADQCVVRAAQFDPNTDSWSTPVTLSDPAQNATQADVLINGSGEAMAIWRSTASPSGTVIQASLFDGTNWDLTADTLSTNSGSPRGPQISVSPAGEFTIVWYRSLNATTNQVESRQATAGVYTPPLASNPSELPLSTNENAELSRVVADTAGNVTALWQGTIGGTTKVRASRFNGTTWSTPADVTPTGVALVDDGDANTVGPFETLAPQLAVDPAGNATAVWQQTDGGSTRIMTSRSSNGVTWSAPAILSAADGNALNPRVDADAAGNVTALWRRFDSGGFAIIQTARYSAMSSTWGSVVDLSTGGRQSQGQRLAVDAAGNVTAVWRRNNAQQESIIQSSRFTPATNSWSAARDLSAPGQDATSPSTDVDANGNVIVVWARINDSGFSVIQSSTSTNIPGFIPVTPVRVFDTRPGESPNALRSVLKQKVGGTYELSVQFSDLPGAITPATGLSAVSMNVTVDQPDQAGFVTVFPCDTKSEVSNVNFLAGQTVANAVIAPVSADGRVCFFSNTPTHILADLNGYFPENSGFTTVSPKRVFDTRVGQSPDALLGGVKNQIGGSVQLVAPMTNLGGGAVTPASGVSAVSINVTVTNPVASGFVTVYPCGTEIPFVSSVNFVAGQTVANAVIAPLAANGSLCFFSNVNTDVIADISGWFPTASGYAPATPPARVFDTRAGQSPEALRSVPKAKIGGTNELRVNMLNLTDVTPPQGVTAVSLNVTVTNPIGPGFVTVYPCSNRQLVSSVNFVAGQTVANAVIVPLAANGDLCFFSNLDTDLVVDINGFFAA
ncbi:MAG: hypothetical protein AB7L17_03390 [Ilumatobacteraceae bacterium]|jgi:hypothetical protein